MSHESAGAIPAAIEETVLAALRGCGDPSPITTYRHASRGGVSSTLRFQSEAGDYFLKWNNKPQFGTFDQERFQLSLLRETHTVRVPDVLGFAECDGDAPGWMLQRWAGRMSRENQAERLGPRLAERLAELHRKTAGTSPGYGYVTRNLEGPPRLPTQDWPGFLYDGHLKHHVERARRENRWTPERNRRVDRLRERLPELLAGGDPIPSILHGDLHSGNVRLSPNGEPVVVDPWLYFGDRELEITTTLVSGDFPPAFYETYQRLYPLPPGHTERADIYRLVWLLSPFHYGPDSTESHTANAIADPILQRYTDI